MKARLKITLWTSSFALAVAIIFSAFVFYELMEQPLRFIDRELRDIRDLAIQQVEHSSNDYSEPTELTEHPYVRYWIKVTEKSGKPLLQTPLIHHVEIVSRVDDRFYFIKRDIALENLWIAEEDRDELDEIVGKKVYFRVLNEVRTIHNNDYSFIVAKPIPILVQEIVELIVEIIIWILLCIILSVIASYYLAGKILKPLTEINILVKEISDISLHKRLPIDNNRDELQTLSLSLNTMFDRLQNSFERQKEYIGNASHELKSPLTILMLGHEKILSEPLDETVRIGVEKQLDTLRRLSKLVRNLLEISRLEQHESINKELFDLKPLILHTVEEFEDVLTKKEIQLHSELQSIRLFADPDKILQMLINLLDNAIKYNLPSNGQIWLNLNKVGNNIEFSISNTGVTIPEYSLSKIFEQFYRVEQSRSTMFGGAGLGLSIVHQILIIHQASIEVTSDHSGLTTFLVRFPDEVQ